MPENQNEYIKLAQEGVDAKGVDKFVLDEALLKKMYENAIAENGSKGGKEEFEALKKEVLSLVKGINDGNEDLLDTGISDFSGSLSVNEDQEKIALGVVKEKIISKMNSNIDKFLGDKFELENQLFSFINDEKLLPENLSNEIKQALKDGDKSYAQQLASYISDMGPEGDGENDGKKRANGGIASVINDYNKRTQDNIPN